MFDHLGVYANRSWTPVPALQSCLIEPIWHQFSALLPDDRSPHPLVGNRPRIRSRIVFDKLIQVLVFGAAYWRIADSTCSATTLRRRRDEWIELGVVEGLERRARDAYDRMIGLELDDVVVDGSITKAPCGGELAGRNPVDRAKQGTKRSKLVDAARGDDAPPGPGLRHRQDPGGAGSPRPERQHLPTRPAGALAGDHPLGGGTHQRLAERLQEAAVVHRAQSRGHPLLPQLRQRDHHRPSAHPRRLAAVPLVGPSEPLPMTASITYWPKLLVDRHDMSGSLVGPRAPSERTRSRNGG